MVNNGNLHLDTTLPWHNTSVLKLLLRNHHIYQYDTEPLTPAQAKCIRFIMSNLLYAEPEALEQFTPKFVGKMINQLFKVRSDIRQELILDSHCQDLFERVWRLTEQLSITDKQRWSETQEHDAESLLVALNAFTNMNVLV